jgi:pimeloyl-ACP methyl ester carboxylesterase
VRAWTGRLAAAAAGGAAAVVVLSAGAPGSLAQDPAGPPGRAAGCGSPGVDSVLRAPDRGAPGGVRTIWVHRPAGADRPSLPVLYLLHGYPSSAAAVRASGVAGLLDAQMCRTGRPFVLAVPDGQVGDGSDTEWSDAADGRFGLETFLLAAAIPLVERGGRRPGSLRAVAGMSMGGYAAAALALRHPQVFGQAVSFGGYFRIDDPDGVFADPAAHDPSRLIDRPGAAGVRFFLVEGRGEQTPLMHGSISGETERFAALLRQHRMSVATAHPPGGHDTATWYTALPAAVDFLDTGWHS